jgi:L-ascorbate metabolism protein UlaG (beta-lactamase superfamily)
VTAVRITHVGGPTVLIEAAGRRLLTDPTFDAPGRDYRFGWGTGSRKLAGPALSPEDLGAIDAVLLSHDHHDDNLDAALYDNTELSAKDVVEKALHIAADICVYTNHSLTIETLG